MKREYFSIDRLFFGFLFAVVSLPILAPIFSALGLHSIAKIIYFVYSFTCHQFASRSIFIADYQYAWCARDTGIWFGFLVAALLYKLGILKQIKWYYFLVFLIPIGLDGGIQTLATIPNIDINGSISSNIFYVSNNLFRFLTGAWFGIGLSLLLTPNIIQGGRREEEGEGVENIQSLESKMHNPKSIISTLNPKTYNLKPFDRLNLKVKYLILMLFVIAIYFILVQIWSISSSEVKPTNLLDSKPKVEETNFFVRRGYGECPTADEDDLFNFKCFFN